MSKDSEEWKTGNGATWYLDTTVGKVTLDSPEKFLAYQANQLRKMFHMTKHIVGYGEAVEKLTLADIETAERAVRELIK
tara:strand:+ start:31 stop:267 length:237 start_codon:yes stop_codon:yes gene_type:complete